MIALFCSRENYTSGEMLFVKHYVLHQSRLTGVTLAYKNTDPVICHRFRLEFPQLEIHSSIILGFIKSFLTHPEKRYILDKTILTHCKCLCKQVLSGIQTIQLINTSPP